jgi:hypothetical protein
MNCYEKAYYDRLTKHAPSLSHKDKLEWMKKLGPRFEQLPPRTRLRFRNQAQREKRSLLIVRRGARLGGFPNSADSWEILRRFKLKPVAELILLRGM